MQMRQAAACLAVAAALAAGCSGGGKDDAATKSGGSTTTAPATTTTVGDHRTAADLQADLATAKQLSLTQADLPAGWTAEPADPSNDSGPSEDQLDQQLAACFHVKPEEMGPNDPESDSPTFTNPAGDEAEIDVAMTASADAGAHQLAILKSAAAPACFSEVLKAATAGSLPAGATMGEIKTVAVPIEAIGDGAAQYRITVPVTAEGQEIPLTVDTVFVLSGRTGITGSFTTYSGQPFDAALARQLTQKVVDRAKPV